LPGIWPQALRPAGYDGEAVYLVAALQSLGRLLVRYHFADEAEQIHQLTQPMPATRIDGEVVVAEQAGLSEQAAAYAVLGVDIETLVQRGSALLGVGRRGPAHDPTPALQTWPCASRDDDNDCCASSPALPTRSSMRSASPRPRSRWH
jgi:hypothetical protein